MQNKSNRPSDKYDPTKYPEMAFLDLVGHQVENFKPWFQTKYAKHIKKTFILSSAISSSFGLEVSGNQAFIGVPKVFFDALYACRMDSVCVVRNQAGIYLIVFVGPSDDICAIRIFCSKRRAEMISRCEEATFMAIDEKGESLPASDRNQFKHNIIIKEGLDWE